MQYLRLPKLLYRTGPNMYLATLESSRFGKRKSFYATSSTYPRVQQPNASLEPKVILLLATVLGFTLALGHRIL